MGRAVEDIYREDPSGRSLRSRARSCVRYGVLSSTQKGKAYDRDTAVEELCDSSMPTCQHLRFVVSLLALLQSVPGLNLIRLEPNKASSGLPPPLGDALNQRLRGHGQRRRWLNIHLEVRPIEKPCLQQLTDESLP